MAFSQGSRSSLSYIKETSYGTVPSTPTFAYLPIRTHSLDLTRDLLEGNDIQADRMPRVLRHGNNRAAGSIEVDLRQGDFDELFESAFMSTFSTNVLKVGTTPLYMAFEDAAADISEYRLYTGHAVSTMNVSMAPNQMVTCTFGMVGKNVTQASSTASTGGTPTASTGNAPFDSYNATISEGGSALASASALDFTLSNNLDPAFVIGSKDAAQLIYGRAMVEGTLSVYYESEALINKFLNETSTSLSVAMSSSEAEDDTYTFVFPNIRYTSASIPLGGEGARIVTLAFRGLYNAGTATNIQLTRTA